MHWVSNINSIDPIVSSQAQGMGRTSVELEDIAYHSNVDQVEHTPSLPSSLKLRDFQTITSLATSRQSKLILNKFSLIKSK